MNRKRIRRKKKRKEEKEIRIDERKEKKEVSRECMSGRDFFDSASCSSVRVFFAPIFDFLVEVDFEFLDSINFYHFLPQKIDEKFQKSRSEIFMIFTYP